MKCVVKLPKYLRNLGMPSIGQTIPHNVIIGMKVPALTKAASSTESQTIDISKPVQKKCKSYNSVLKFTLKQLTTIKKNIYHTLILHILVKLIQTNNEVYFLQNYIDSSRQLTI